MITFNEMSEEMKKEALELNDKWFFIQMGSYREMARYEKQAIDDFNNKFGTAYKTFICNFYGNHEAICLK